MAGIYLHIPFCRQACHYCNFHFSTSLSRKAEVIKAIQAELRLRQSYLSGQTIRSIYFGGGTPSLLDEGELKGLLHSIYTTQQVDEEVEITLEANPDDINKERLLLWKKLGINRLSIGIQSFSENDLRYMNRAHNRIDALKSLELALATGFENLTADLIYGSPGTTMQVWKENIDQMLAFNLPHISAYCLTVEPGTALDYFVRKGKTQAVDEEKAVAQFDYLIDRLENAGYLHYEISNFARPGSQSRHNSAYWQGQPYLGLGPSAHSYNQQSRQWNVSDNMKYLKAIEAGLLPQETEVITSGIRYNEYVMTSLRTMEGCDLAIIKETDPKFLTYFISNSRPFFERGWIEEKVIGKYSLTRAGKHYADYIASSLFLDE